MRRVLLLLLSVLMLLSVIPAASAVRSTGYADVSADDWFASAVTYVSERGLMQGVGAGKFQPEQVMTRGMVVTLLHRLACEPDSALQNSFSDVYDSHYAAKAVRWACETGIASGVSKDRFSPNGNITREQAAVFLYRYAAYQKLPTTETDKQLPFSDSDQISEYARPAVAWAVGVGILQSSTDTMNPKSFATRAEIAVMVMRFQLWADRFSSGKLLPGEIVSVLGKKVRAVRSNGRLYVPAQTVEAPGASSKYIAYFNNIRYLSLDYYTEVQGCIEGISPSGMRYIAKTQPLTLPEAGTAVPILMYHAVSDSVWGMEELFVGPDALEQQLRYLVYNGYDPIWFEDLADLRAYDKPVILTFDDGYLDNYTVLFPLLQRYQVKATFFVIGETICWEKKMNHSQLYEFSHSGLVSVQSHTYNHEPLDTLTAAQQEYEMQASQAAVAAITGTVPRVLCYPGGRYNDTTLQLVSQYYDFALKWDGGLYTTGDDPYTISRFYVARSTDMKAFRSFLK